MTFNKKRPSQICGIPADSQAFLQLMNQFVSDGPGKDYVVCLQGDAGISDDVKAEEKGGQHVSVFDGIGLKRPMLMGKISRSLQGVATPRAAFTFVRRQEANVARDPLDCGGIDGSRDDRGDK